MAIAMPIQNALAPISRAQSGIMSVIIGIWLRLKKPVPNTAARPRRFSTAGPAADVLKIFLSIAYGGGQEYSSHPKY